MKYEPQAQEAKWIEQWEKDGLYHFDPQTTKEVYSIDTPPPTVSGAIHIGHIFSYTQAEIIARYKRMKGFEVFYPFGFDDNGLPTEKLTEKEFDIKGEDTPRDEFIEKCLEVTEKYGEQYKQLWQRIGLSVDWNCSYSTISPYAQKQSQKSFIKLLKDGYVERKKQPTLWCPTCKTSVAQAEVDDKEKDSQFHDITFTLEDGSDLIIATTRPELLPACVAVFVNPNDDRYKDHIGKKVTTAIGDEVTLLADEKAEMDKGTGAVMCCTYGDETDIYWKQAHNLEEKVIIDKGAMITHPFYPETMYVKKARKYMVEKLTEMGKLVSSKDITHTVGVHERCDTPMEIYPISQWFVNVLDKKEEILAASNKINWRPDFMQKRLIDWVENLKWDWSISRQRFYGIPIPIYYDAEDNIVIPDESELPIDPQNNTKEGLTPDTDVLDTWATSAITPELNSRWEEEDSLEDLMTPFSMRPQAHDIIRTWALYTIIKSHYHKEEIPWKDIMVSGHVLAGKGEKISKSKSNAKKGPIDFIEEYSADAVRYWTAGAALGKDIILDEGEMKNGKKLVNKLWNLANFAQMQLEGYAGEVPEKLEATDQWIIEEIAALSDKLQAHLDDYEIGLARVEFEKFFWSEYCDNYLEIIKDRLYKPEKYENGELKKISGQYALKTSLDALMRMVAPFLPFITEEIYTTHFSEGESIHKKAYPSSSEFQNLPDETRNSEQLQKGMSIFKELIEKARKHKTEAGISLGAELEEVAVTASAEEIDALAVFADDIKGVTKADSVSFLQDNNPMTIEIK